MKITWDDVVRVIAEENEQLEGRDPAEIVPDWFEKHNFDEEFCDTLVKHINDGFGEVMNHVLGRYLEENRPESGSQLPPEVFASAIGSVGLGMFTLGFLVKEQFGAAPTELPEL